jgi:hypothetical protein
MPIFSSKPQPPDPAKLYRCLGGFVMRSSSGQDVTIREDEKLWGGHEAVVRHPDFFTLDGQDDAAIYQAKNALTNAVIARALAPKKRR